MNTAGFGALSPELALEAVECAYGLRLEGTFEVLPSYVNRVYGIADETGRRFVVKFYRPGRWSDEAIGEEHAFIARCAARGIPVVRPVVTVDGGTLALVEYETENTEPGGNPAGLSSSNDAPEDDTPEDDAATATLRFALYPRVPGHGFDPETEEDWLALGRVVGALHAATADFEAPHRVRMDSSLARAHAALIEPLVHPDLRLEFSELCARTIALGEASLRGLRMRTIHGDLHRGNILVSRSPGAADRPPDAQGGNVPKLAILDFDDLSAGPAIQDLWLLLPGRSGDCRRELALLAEGYTESSPLDPAELGAVEILRFHRILHFLAWEAIQRNDDRFTRDHPDWGSRAFWIKEVEDLRDQAGFLPDQD